MIIPTAEKIDNILNAYCAYQTVYSVKEDTSLCYACSGTVPALHPELIKSLSVERRERGKEEERDGGKKREIKGGRERKMEECRKERRKRRERIKGGRKEGKKGEEGGKVRG